LNSGPIRPGIEDHQFGLASTSFCRSALDARRVVLVLDTNLADALLVTLTPVKTS